MMIEIPGPWKLWLRAACLIIFGIILLLYASDWAFCHNFCGNIIMAVAIISVAYGLYLTEIHKKIFSTTQR